MELTTLIQRRVYLGNIVGYRILANFNKIAVTFEDNTLNNILAASIESAFLSATSGRFINMPLHIDNLSYSTERIQEFSPQSLVIIMGGNDEKYTSQLFKLFAYHLNSKEFHADILIDGVDFEEQKISEIARDKNVYQLFEENNIYVFTINPKEGIVILSNLVPSAENWFELYSINEFPISFDHGKLLNTKDS